MKPRLIDELLADHEFFATLSPEDRGVISGCGRNETFAAGSALAREGGQADQFFLLRAGLVALQIPVPAGETDYVVETLGPGEVVGFSWIFPPHRWSFDVVAVEPTRVVAFDGACLRGKCDEDQALGYRLMQRFARLLTQRLEATRLRLLDVYGVHDGA